MQYLDPIVTPDRPDVDVVFVHGLNPKGSETHARQTWTDHGGVFWPESLLPRELPLARILIFAYNSSILSRASNAHVASHARTLCDRLKNRRLEEQEIHRPLVFVAHSLGGLLVKQALVQAGTDPLYKCLKASTFGLVFFATPHRGGEGAGVAEAAAMVYSAVTGQPRNKLLDSLKKKSLINELSSDQFRHQMNDYEVLSFIERRKMPVKTLPFWPAKNMVSTVLESCKRRSSYRKYIVDETSAKLGSARENHQDVDRNHSDICKFSGFQDRAYEGVAPNLKAMVNRASRDNLLEEIQRQWDYSAQRRIALVGLGGVGKTELGILFVEKLHSQSYVLWLRASNHQVLQDDLLKAAREFRHELLHFYVVGSPAVEEDQGATAFYFSPMAMSELHETLKLWVKAMPKDKSRILVILDDLDGLDSVFHKEYSHIFAGDAVDLIYTSRDPSIADPGMLWEAMQFEVPPLPMEEAVSVMDHFARHNHPVRTQVDNSSSQSDLSFEDYDGNRDDVNRARMRGIASRLGGLPAAIIIGSQYMRDNLGSKWNPDCYKNFLDLWDQHDGKLNILQSHRSMLKYRYSILTSVQVSLDRLRRNTGAGPRCDTHELCLILLWLLSAMDLHTISRDDLRLLKKSLRIVSPDLQDLVRLIPGFGLVPTNKQSLVHGFSVDYCIAELVKVSLLTQRSSDGACLLNTVTKTCVLLVPIKMSVEQRAAVEGLAERVQEYMGSIEIAGSVSKVE
ncbi:MAG: hypothetical protein Q9181_005069 [Wetmoreana brouardii]